MASAFRLTGARPRPPDVHIKSRIAIDKSPIAPFRSLPVGYDLSARYPAGLTASAAILPIERELLSRADSTFSDQPLLVTQLADSGPDCDFFLSIQTLSVITAALQFDAPLSVVLYQTNNQLFADEPIRNPSNDWAAAFGALDLPIEHTTTESITHLQAVAAHAYDDSRSPRWFGEAKGDLVSSERQQQRWDRRTEALLRRNTDSFTRSFVCSLSAKKREISLHIGSNSCFCEFGDGSVAILRCLRDEPTPEVMQKWALESVISHCPEVLRAAAVCLRVAIFERIRLPQKQPLLFSSLYEFLSFAKERAAQPGCYLLHKRRSDDQIQLIPFALEDPRLTRSFANRLGLLESVTGFRQTLSMSAPIVANGRDLLRHAATLLDTTNAILCLERVADSHILPILLTDRTSVLICADPQTIAKVPLADVEQAITLYTSAIGMLTADSPALLVE
jgi:hypothetical protein